MEYKRSAFFGYERLDFVFEGREAILVLPATPLKEKKWLLKTEYFGAFPSLELEMLRRGYHLAYLANRTRWYAPDDAHSKAGFAAFLQKEFGLHPRCTPVGMSCGGMHAVYFAAEHPERIAALYLDAPVLNLLSCPCAVGAAEDKSMYEEFVKQTGRTVSALINYRNHPIDRADALIAAKIPVCLVCGDSDLTVPYAENGAVLAEKYEKSGLPFLKIVKPGCGHHPHGLEDPGVLADFISAHD